MPAGNDEPAGYEVVYLVASTVQHVLLNFFLRAARAGSTSSRSLPGHTKPAKHDATGWTLGKAVEYQGPTMVRLTGRMNPRRYGGRRAVTFWVKSNKPRAAATKHFSHIPRRSLRVKKLGTSSGSPFRIFKVSSERRAVQGKIPGPLSSTN